jgi:hypothetical protein
VWSSSLAEACGFNVNQASLKSNYLSYEALYGLPPDGQERLSANYDRMRGIVAKMAVSNPDVCTTERVENVRANLARYRAGDFSTGNVL